MKLNSLNLLSAYSHLFSGHADVGSSLILYRKDMSGLLGRRCELVSGDSPFSVSDIEKQFLGMVKWKLQFVLLRQFYCLLPGK